jgi:endonuclease YncB( thermonuclease family)
VVSGRHIRLYGIDAPEASQTCGRADGNTYRCGDTATGFLSVLIGRGAVSCRYMDTDIYGRTVAVCHSYDGLELNREMVSGGYAVAYRRYSTDYVSAENSAKSEQLGIWGGSFEMPWNYRKTASASLR